MKILRLGGRRAAGNLPVQRREKGPQNHWLSELAKQFNSIERGVLLTATSEQPPLHWPPRSCVLRPGSGSRELGDLPGKRGEKIISREQQKKVMKSNGLFALPKI